MDIENIQGWLSDLAVNQETLLFALILIRRYWW